jgi:hypothetical protein
MTAEFPEEYPRYRGRHPLARIQPVRKAGTRRTGPADKG